MLTETHKKNWAGQHSELFYWTSYGQFKSKMNLPLEKVSKIPRGAMTIKPIQCLSKRGNVTMRGKMFTTNERVFDISRVPVVSPNFLKPNIFHMITRYTVVSLCPLFCASHLNNLAPYSKTCCSVS